jgi:hypothetical protein
MLRLGSFNIQNLFERSTILDDDLTTDIREKIFLMLKSYAEFNYIIAQTTYTHSDKSRLIELIKVLDLFHSDYGDFVTLRQNRGRLIHRSHQGEPPRIVGWAGWILKKKPLMKPLHATRHV